MLRRIVFSQARAKVSNGGVFDLKSSFNCNFINVISQYYCTSTQPPLTLTDGCVKAIHERNSDGSKFLRIGLTRGCHGYMYEYFLKDNYDPNTDIVIEKDNAKVVVDKDVLKKIEGSTVDFEFSMEREGFNVSLNPKALSSCGCNRSFTPDTFEDLLK